MDDELGEIEIDLLLEGIFRLYGCDFRSYARSHLRRRIGYLVTYLELNTISELQNKVLHDHKYWKQFLANFSIHVTSMFRDPSFYLAFRNQVIPILKTYPYIRIWHAGCSTGEEVYSMAILLEEEGVYHRCRLYATDLNETLLAQAQARLLPLNLMQDYTINYHKAGGKKSFSEYYTVIGDNVVISDLLKKNIVFGQHNLAIDASFNEFNVVVCRNVLIYFNTSLQGRVHNLFYESLAKFGILILGKQETIRFTPHEQNYKALNATEKIYRKIC
ncbi:CheR family methyltransferase [Calothrix sp. PCC 6303]|uniref:CheR family methyltransferase n=1 Tax=Calothrix sp. PCC 6303 TaxID=1170562 RepID=UPI0002A0110E|nr:protein-glutamate O-methyltransferase CheR [Calothrix sp. PCC 6303]AFZ02830.1 MCP methyltransferase, CheR-type [Calothrix sp. PCC 6303]